MTRKVAWLAARSSFESASEDLRELIDVSVSSSEFHRVAHEVGEAFEEIDGRKEEEWNRPVSPERPAPEAQMNPDLLVVTADATTVLTVAGEEHKSVWCGRAFALEARGRKESSGRPFITESLFTASGMNLEDFAVGLKALAYRCGARGAKEVAFIADGARCLWILAASLLPITMVLIQDFWHVCEHLSQLTKDLYGEDWQGRFERWKEMIHDSRVEEVLVELRAEKRRMDGEKGRRLSAEIGYLEGARERMDYVRYRRQGWPIGAGAIEGTCKHLVKQRFCVTGARWRRANIPAVLALRQAQANGDWDEY